MIKTKSSFCFLPYCFLLNTKYYNFTFLKLIFYTKLILIFGNCFKKCFILFYIFWIVLILNSIQLYNIQYSSHLHV